MRYLMPGNDSMLKKILRGSDPYNVAYIEIVRYGTLFLDRLLNEGNFFGSILHYCSDLYSDQFKNINNRFIGLKNI